MSWDISIHLEPCNHCNRSVDYIDVRNLTYNNRRIMESLGIGYDFLQKKRCIDIIPILEFSQKQIHERWNELKKLEPENGWGGVADVQDFIEKLLLKCREYPLGEVMFD